MGRNVEHDFWVIEQADKSLNFSAGDGQVVTIGTWRRSGARVIATRRVVWRTAVASLNNEEPSCTKPDLDFGIASDHVKGATSATGIGEYRRNARLSISEFESYIPLAKRDGKTCSAV
jgi:hypothetical protein